MVAVSLQKLKPHPKIKHLAIGVFDGVHRGHQAVIAAARHAAPSARSTGVITFDPHPLEIVAPEKAPPRLIPLHERAHLLKEAGGGTIFVLRFNSALRQLSAADFIKELLRIFPHLSSLAIGYDWAFGKDRQGSYDSLITSGVRYGFTTHTIPPRLLTGRPISSTRIRDSLRHARLHEIKQLLGRPWHVTGKVIKGDQRGRTLGFPTANLGQVQHMLPANGVYVCWVKVGKNIYRAVANCGTHPTVHELTAPKCEVHLLDFQGNLYGRQIDVFPIRRLRREKKFPTLTRLQSQIQADILRARKILNRPFSP
jgi:riboflavin kinase / FMN adenylyltransferase